WNQRYGGGALAEDVAQPRVVDRRRTQADQLALGPCAPTVHRRIDAAGERRLTGKADVSLEARGVDIERRVQRLDRDAGAIAHRLVRVDLRCIVGGPANLRFFGRCGDWIVERL